MAKYQVLMHFSDGTSEYDDEIFDNEAEAEEYGTYLVGCADTGAELQNMSNPGDYPMDDYSSPEYEVVEIDE